MSGGREFDWGKFKELVLLLAERSAADPLMSRVELTKLLYRIDFESYRLLGQSMTGATYIKGEHGPMAAELPVAEEELGRSGYLEWRIEQAGPYEQKVPVAKEKADKEKFSEAELEIIDAALAELAELGGKAASKWSHETSVGWRVMNPGEAIPYETALISAEPLDDSTLAALRAFDSEP
jgi:hypothetical protein